MATNRCSTRHSSCRYVFQEAFRNLIQTTSMLLYRTCFFLWGSFLHSSSTSTILTWTDPNIKSPISLSDAFFAGGWNPTTKIQKSSPSQEALTTCSWAAWWIHATNPAWIRADSRLSTLTLVTFYNNRILPTAWGRFLSWDLASSLQPWILDAHEIFPKTETPLFSYRYGCFQK